jgi:hypothetical protein
VAFFLKHRASADRQLFAIPFEHHVRKTAKGKFGLDQGQINFD